jgi:hypothetical protein
MKSCLLRRIPIMMMIVQLILQLVHLNHQAHEVVNGDATKDLVRAKPVELMQLLQPLQLRP